MITNFSIFEDLGTLDNIVNKYTNKYIIWQENFGDDSDYFYIFKIIKIKGNNLCDIAYLYSTHPNVHYDDTKFSPNEDLRYILHSDHVIFMSDNYDDCMDKVSLLDAANKYNL